MRRSGWAVVLLAVVLSLAQSGRAHALPAFARREGFSCQVCHFRVPELNEVGREYARRGLRMQGEQAPAPRALGEPLALKLENYVSLMGDHNISIQKGADAQFNAGTVDLWVGGPLEPKWSALMDATLNIQGGGSTVAQGYAHFITGGGDRIGSARFGQLLPFAILLDQGGPPTLSLSMPAVLATPADTGTSWTPTTLVRGVEVGGIDSDQWNAYLGLGQPDLSGDTHTDIYASLERRFPKQQAALAGYGYWGKAPFAAGGESSFHRVGLFGHWQHSQTLGVAGYLTGSDEAADGHSLDSSGYFLLAEQLLSGRWSAYGRYDHLRQDLSAGGAETIQGPALGVSWWAATEVRLTAEAQFLETTDLPSSRSLVLDLQWIF